MWTSFTGGVYEVQYKSNCSSPVWTLLSPTIVAATRTASITNAVGVLSQRYYRVRLLPCIQETKAQTVRNDSANFPERLPLLVKAPRDIIRSRNTWSKLSLSLRRFVTEGRFGP